MTEKITEHIEEQIMLGKLEPGDKINESDLTKKFGVSRTPIREALIQLSSLGLIELKSRRGAAVRKLNGRELVEMFEAMAELEAICGRLAARRITPSQIKKLEEYHAASLKYIKADNTNAYYEINTKFHDVLYEAASNKILEKQVRILRFWLTPFRRAQLTHPGRMLRSFEEHGEILEAISTGQPEMAEQAIKSHVAVQSDVFLDFITKVSDQIFSNS